ncbi:MAG: hypothetical protein NVS1B13_25210 [Flavisolibacter sp.]
MYNVTDKVWNKLNQEQRTQFDAIFPDLRKDRTAIINTLPPDERATFDTPAFDTVLAEAVARTITLTKQLVTH